MCNFYANKTPEILEYFILKHVCNQLVLDIINFRGDFICYDEIVHIGKDMYTTSLFFKSD